MPTVDYKFNDKSYVSDIISTSVNVDDKNLMIFPCKGNNCVFQASDAEDGHIPAPFILKTDMFDWIIISSTDSVFHSIIESYEISQLETEGISPNDTIILPLPVFQDSPTLFISLANKENSYFAEYEQKPCVVHILPDCPDIDFTTSDKFTYSDFPLVGFVPQSEVESESQFVPVVSSGSRYKGYKSLFAGGQQPFLGDTVYYYLSPINQVRSSTILPPTSNQYIGFKSTQPFSLSWNSDLKFACSFDTLHWERAGSTVQCVDASYDTYYYIFLTGLGNDVVNGITIRTIFNDQNPDTEAQVTVAGNITCLRYWNSSIPLNNADYIFSSQTCLYSVSDLVIPATTRCRYAFYNTSIIDLPVIDYTYFIDNQTIIPTNQFENMFSTCNNLIDASQMSFPDVKLGDRCYIRMFIDCSYLKKLPQLQSTHLAINCYSQMFNGCMSLKLSTVQTGSYDTPFKIPYNSTIDDPSITGSSVAGSMFSATGGTFTGTPEINTTYYLDIT